MVVAPSGVLYVNTWSGRYYGNDTPHAGGFLVALQDKSGTGKADVIERSGDPPLTSVRQGIVSNLEQANRKSESAKGRKR
jgi:hypothetical protein